MPCEQDVQKLIGRKDVSLDLCSKIENGKLRVDQGVIAGCAGGLYDSIYEAASILKGHTGGCGDYALSVYPGSQPIMMELVRTGVIRDLMASRCHHPHCVLRPLLRRGRRARQRRAVHPPYHPQLPQPRRLQARQRPAFRRGTDGCPQHCGHHGQRRHSDPGYRYRL